MLDWRTFTKLNHIKNLPLMEQKRKFLEEVSLLEEEIRMSHSQFITTNPNGAAGGPPPETIYNSPEIEMLDENGNVISTQAGIHLVYEQS